MNHEKNSVSNSKRDFSLAPGMKITDAELDEMVGGSLEYKAYFDDDKKIHLYRSEYCSGKRQPFASGECRQPVRFESPGWLQDGVQRTRN